MSEARGSSRALAALLALPDAAIDLGQASLLIAREEYPDLQVGVYLAHLEELAAAVRARLRGGEGFTTLVAHLNRLLFDELGFRGGREEQPDPRDSFLNEVLDRRIGAPVSLSTIYIEVGRRIGCPLAGVSFPGHFLVRHGNPGCEQDILIDPLNRGALLTETDCRRRLRAMYDGRVEFKPEFLRRVLNREILDRMLVDLKRVYQGERDYHRALRVQNQLLCLHPDRPETLRDRGLIYDCLACFAQAADDLSAYTKAAPDAPDAPAVRRRLRILQVLSPVMN
jgi:regulator of sirC expression with transglutaminase-like and TPR domain